RKHRSERSERGAQRAYCDLAAGALEVFAAESSITYCRAAGALEVLAADPLTTIYQKSTY
ncbi:hypothetical protein, partial [Halorubrum distributum]|uniref:hypothetical protein n=1 Tax=Halorubrum distributum TaxID=29283 RepID=UPI00373AE5C4